MTLRYCKTCTGWHDLDRPWPDNCRQEDWRQRSELPAPYTISFVDEVGSKPVKSMLDGKYYLSKKKLRQTYKDHGMIEVGNDSSVTNPKPFVKPKPDRKEIRAAVRRAFSRAGMGA